MVMLNLNEEYSAQKRASTKEGREAISNYIKTASELIVEHGKDTDFWPDFALKALLKAGGEAHNIVGTTKRKQKARETGGVNLGDFY